MRVFTERFRSWRQEVLRRFGWQAVRASVEVVRFRPRQIDLTLACGAHQGAAAPVVEWLRETRHHPRTLRVAGLPHAVLRTVAAYAAQWFGPTASALVRWLGGAVAGAADTASAGALQRSLSLRANPGWLVPHPHAVAVLAVDMRGFSTLTRELEDTQYLADLIGEYLTALTQVVERHRGVIFDYTGDGLLALFLPELLGCGPRAMLDELVGRIGEELHASFGVLYARWRTEWHASGRGHVPIGLGSGLSFGRATIGFLGPSGKKHFGVVGEPVNMAAYLCSQAHGGTLLVDRDAFLRAGGAPPEGRTVRLRSKKPHQRIVAVCRSFAGGPLGLATCHLGGAMDDARAELQGAEDETRQHAASLRERARRLRVRGFADVADELEAQATGLQETADIIATQLADLPPSSA